MCTSREYEINTLFIVRLLETSEEIAFMYKHLYNMFEFMKPHNIIAINHSKK